MKTLKFGLLLLFGMTIFSCTDTSNDINPQEKNDDSSGETLLNRDRNDRLFKIGIMKEEEFQFTVSDENLAQVYEYNIEANLEASGELESADVLPSDGNGEVDYYLSMAGTLSEEGSARFYADVILEDDPQNQAVKIVYIRKKPVHRGLCHSDGCSNCEQEIYNTVPFIHCQCTPNGVCPYVDDPFIVWVE